MARVVGIGNQDFGKIRRNGNFYVDKTDFIRQWWESYDDVTLITRPRRFGKTLNMSMLEQFFSIDYAGRGELFEGLSIWQEEKYRQLQGTYPVIALSFAKIKGASYPNVRKEICQTIADLFNQFHFLLESEQLNEYEKKAFHRISDEMEDHIAANSLNFLSNLLMRHYGKKVIILLDEYDTPMQEAYVNGYWEELVEFTRSLFNATFKTNPYLERALMTGITRVSKESIFSDLNNLKVVTTTSEKYADSFGFTEEEVFTALEEYGLSARKQQVKDWYDGFVFGSKRD
ncbi:MAG: AAA family ATPase, partial [Lachnospiraceae bacterium]|nr:AAA family ATPase [Lachnospiraceae bacterium]